MSKNNLRPFIRCVTYCALRISVLVWGSLPLRITAGLARALGRLAYTIARKERRIACDGLAIAFPSAPARERDAIARGFFSGMVRSPLEILYYLRRRGALAGVRVEGREYLDKALAAGSGVIGLTAHFGNFPLMNLKLASDGYPVYQMMRPMRDARIGAYIHRLQESVGIRPIYSFPRKAAVEGALRALRRGGIVFVQMDQDFHGAGMRVLFFGRPASTAVGPVIFALRTGAKVLPMFIARRPSGAQCIHILPEAEIIRGIDRDDTIRKTAQHFTSLIEHFIRRYPAEWGWIHRRWNATA